MDKMTVQIEKLGLVIEKSSVTTTGTSQVEHFIPFKGDGVRGSVSMICTPVPDDSEEYLRWPTVSLEVRVNALNASATNQIVHIHKDIVNAVSSCVEMGREERLSADSLCFLFVGADGTNPVYHVQDQQTGTNLLGAVQYLDRCVTYASTNICVHVRVGQTVRFADVAPLMQACSQRDISRVIFYWSDAEKGAPHFSSQSTHLLKENSDPRMQPFTDD
jgi:hypothetical protein